MPIKGIYPLIKNLLKNLHRWPENLSIQCRERLQKWETQGLLEKIYQIMQWFNLYKSKKQQYVKSEPRVKIWMTSSAY